MNCSALKHMGVIRLASMQSYVKNLATYIQGQPPDHDPKSREYFYFIDHQGMLFLDDSKMKNFTSCFKEKKFLKFFFSRVKINDTNRYVEFPFISPCGRETNYIRCDDLPIVFTHLLPSPDDETQLRLSYAHAGDSLTTLFEPQKLCMDMETGRVYHPAPEKYGGVGLVRSQLAIHLSPHFIFQNGDQNPPTQIQWKGNTLKLTQEVVDQLKKLDKVRQYSSGIRKLSL